MLFLLFLAQLAKRDRKYGLWFPFLLHSKDLQRLPQLHGLGDIAVRGHVYSMEDLQFEFVCSSSSKGYPVAARDAYARGQEGQLPLCSHSWGVGGARIALHTELFPFL